MKVAVAQLKSGADKQANLDKAREYIARASKQAADLILFPEVYMAYLPGSSPQTKADVAEALDGPFVSALAEEARKHQLHIICGMYESAPGETVRAYNTTVFLDRSGQLLQAYRKTHLYDAFARKESNAIIPGADTFTAVETEFGKVGLLVCYELRFPEVSRKLVLEGAEVLFLPTAWVTGAMKEDHLETLLRARAIENTVYICAADQTGNIYAGRSMVVDPMGVVVASAGDEEALLVAEIDPDRIRRVRDSLPCLGHRRPELYGRA